MWTFLQRDAKDDQVYVAVSPEVLERGQVKTTVRATDDIALDFDSRGRLLGLDISRASRILGKDACGSNVSGDDLIGVAEAAQLCGVKKPNFIRDFVQRKDFPKPVADLASGRIWRRSDVTAFLSTHGRTEDRDKAPAQSSRPENDAADAAAPISREELDELRGLAESLVIPELDRHTSARTRSKSSKENRPDSSVQVRTLALEIARVLGLDEGGDAWNDIAGAAQLKDVGLSEISSALREKPGPLTPEEWETMKTHSSIGYERLRHVPALAGVSAIVWAHHERFDGKGYPRGLSGDDISLGARIIGVADAFVAMTTDRPYRKALPPEIARSELLRHSGTQFDPTVVEAFLLAYEAAPEEQPTLEAASSPYATRVKESHR